MNQIRLIGRLWNTIRYLKLQQIFFRLYYFVRRKVRKNPKFSSFDYPQINNPMVLASAFLDSPTSWDGKRKFKFLNLSYDFKDTINWNFSSNGKLWTYNLNYFDFLNQSGISAKDGEMLMLVYIQNMDNIEDGMEPYPVSLRIINWIKFIITHKINNEEIERCIAYQLEHLKKNLEYHLLGNHLLENAFGMLWAGVFLKEIATIRKAELLIEKELQEQITEDGSHFELSPMYHMIILYRILDSLNLLIRNDQLDVHISTILRVVAQKMLSWLQTISWKNGQVPKFNDTTSFVSPSVADLLAYAERLELSWGYVNLGDSGFRKYLGNRYEIVFDAGQIGPDYIPGHAHADSLHFEMRVNDKPFIVDTGISTYENNQTRWFERSTAAHNTVLVKNTNSSEVWGAFRVARRAKTNILEETENTIITNHDGYKKKFGVMHQRSLSSDKNSVIIEDFLVGEKLDGKAFFHFAPELEIELNGDELVFDDIFLKWKGAKSISIKEYEFAHDYNITQSAKCIEVDFHTSLTTEIFL